MRLEFTKMQGLGNDFVVLDALRQPIALDDEQLRRLADRRFGVGCDQILMVLPTEVAGADFGYRIFNADGGEVEHCGNGVRCVGRFLAERGYTREDRITVATLSGLTHIQLLDDGRVTVDMGAPRLAPAEIPFTAEQQQTEYALDVDGVTVRFGAVSMGNPHAVIRVDDVDDAPVRALGPRLQAHPAFPRQVNVGFMQILDRGRIRLRVYERGAGETLACGTGACAAVVAGRLQDLLDASVRVGLRGGDLQIEWQGPGESVWMTGPADTVFTGAIEI